MNFWNFRNACTEGKPAPAMADRASASTRNVYYNFTSPRSSKLVCPGALTNPVASPRAQRLLPTVVIVRARAVCPRHEWWHRHVPLQPPHIPANDGHKAGALYIS